MSGFDWTEQDARDWLTGDIEHIDHRAVLTLLLAELDKLRKLDDVASQVTDAAMRCFPESDEFGCRPELHRWRAGGTWSANVRVKRGGRGSANQHAYASGTTAVAALEALLRDVTERLVPTGGSA